MSVSRKRVYPFTTSTETTLRATLCWLRTISLFKYIARNPENIHELWLDDSRLKESYATVHLCRGKALTMEMALEMSDKSRLPVCFRSKNKAIQIEFGGSVSMNRIKRLQDLEKDRRESVAEPSKELVDSIAPNKLKDKMNVWVTIICRIIFSDDPTLRVSPRDSSLVVVTGRVEELWTTDLLKLKHDLQNSIELSFYAINDELMVEMTF